MDLRIGLLWHSINSGNLGVGALTVSNLAIARQAAAAAGVRPRFCIIGFLADEFARYVDGEDIDILPLDGRAMLPGGAYWRRLGQLDCVLDIGAGDSFADIYGAKRFGYLWLTKAMALARHKPLVFSPQTIGPFTRQPQRRLAAAVMNRAEHIFARDPLSFDVARELAPRAKVSRAIDVAFGLPFEPRGRGPGTNVGVNVSGLLFNGGYTGANEFGMQVDYRDYTRRLIAGLLDLGASDKLVCHVYSSLMPKDDDARVADQLASEFAGVERVADFASPSAAKSYISGLDFLVGGRMHACIAAFSSGVAVVPVAYSRKFSGLFEGALGYRHTVPVTGLSTDEAVAFTLERFEQRQALAAEIAQALPGAMEKLTGYRAELERLFARLKQAPRGDAEARLAAAG